MQSTGRYRNIMVVPYINLSPPPFLLHSYLGLALPAMDYKRKSDTGALRCDSNSNHLHVRRLDNLLQYLHWSWCPDSSVLFAGWKID